LKAQKMANPKATEKKKSAGAAALAEYQKTEEFKLQNVTHGAYSSTIRQRYSDKRTTEGKQLHAVISAITVDLGGPVSLNAGQQVLIASLRGKLIVLFQISDYLDRQDNIFDSEGNVLPCLRQTYLAYSEAVRRTLEALYGLSNTKLRRSKVPRLEEIISKSKAN
jgi:hypothetical protein